MPYVVPSFPLTCNIWRATNPTTNPPDVISLCNLTPGRRTFLPVNAEGVGPPPPPAMFMELLLPNLVDIRGWNDALGGDVVEVPAGSGRTYKVAFVDDIAKGFSNVHRFAILLQQTPWPGPIP